MQKNLIVPEENYGEIMRTKVEPYLEERAQEFSLEREKGKILACIRYRADSPKGVVVISHGYTESAEKYKEIIYYFVKEGYQVYMAEHCGHGKSYRLTEDPYLVHVDSYLRYVEDLLFVGAKAREENPGLNLFLYGHSMGGGIGAAAAGREPELFRKVILTSPMIRPLTGEVPWGIMRAAVGLACALGKKGAYGNGHPYDGKEKFEESASLSKERFEYYREKRKRQQELQMSGASFGWLKAVGDLDQYLRREAVKRIKVPVLLFQAEEENLVSEEAQNRFIKGLQQRGVSAKTIKIQNSKHEIFNARNQTLEEYWGYVFAFLENT